MMSMRQMVLVAAAVVLGLLAVFGIPSLYENLDAHELMVVQSPVSGELTAHTEPGIKWQGFGQVTKYPRRADYAFGVEGAAKGTVDTAKLVQFNDGGHAFLYGGVSWEMPLAPADIVNIHKTFGSAAGVEHAAVARMIDAAVYLAGPLMSSTESSGERRAELVQYINDQAEHGVYVTQVREKEVVDPITGLKKSAVITEIMRDAQGNPRRQQGSILGEFKIKLLPLSISKLKYDAIVEKQIAERQMATTQVQIAQANAKRAEQEKLTTEAQGAANAAKAKWEQETIKAKMVTEAQQKLDVATLAAKEAEQYKREQILRGEGDAQRRQLVMAADGALDRKLDTYIAVQKFWSEAFAKFGGQMVPTTVMGSTGTSSLSNAQSFVDLMTVKTARDLSLDLSASNRNPASVPAAVSVPPHARK